MGLHNTDGKHAVLIRFICFIYCPFYFVLWTLFLEHPRIEIDFDRIIRASNGEVDCGDRTARHDQDLGRTAEVFFLPKSKWLTLLRHCRCFLCFCRLDHIHNFCTMAAAVQNQQLHSWPVPWNNPSRAHPRHTLSWSKEGVMKSTVSCTEPTWISQPLRFCDKKCTAFLAFPVWCVTQKLLPRILKRINKLKRPSIVDRLSISKQYQHNWFKRQTSKPKQKNKQISNQSYTQANKQTIPSKPKQA